MNVQWSYFNNPGDEPLLGETLGQVLNKTVEKCGNDEAIVFCQNNIRKNYAEFKRDVDKFAAGLLAIGLKKADRIGIWSPNYYEYLITQFASAAAGLVLVLINPAYQPRELKYCLTKVGIRAIVAAESFKTQDYYKMLTTVIPSLPRSKPGEIKDKLVSLNHVIMISEKKYNGTFSFFEILNCGKNIHFQELEKLEKIIQFDDPACIMFTSGTTGYPKGATLTHFNIINNSYLTGKRMGYDKKTHRICLPVPLYHAVGCILGSICSILFGACQIYPAPNFNAEAAAKAVYEENCTCIYGTPTMFIDILNLQNLDEYPFIHCKSGIMAGSTCPEEILKACVSKLNMTEISIAYGSTECLAVAITKITDSLIQCTTTVGCVMEHTEIKIVDSSSLRIVPVGTIGEVWVRGYLIMEKYWNDKEKTEECITNGRWYRTGDLATADTDGYLKIVGRIKDMINRGGENIYPREIEEFLHTHPKIAEVHIVGVPDWRLGEDVCAWIKLKSNETLTNDDVKTFCRGQISHFKIPRYIKFVNEFPLTVTGKVQKFIIREQATDELKLNEVKAMK